MARKPGGNGNIQNWYSSLTPEEKTELARKAARSSVETRAKHRLFRDILKQLLGTPIQTEDERYEVLRQFGIANPRHEDALLLAAMQRAMGGDIEALRFVRDTIGEKPTEAYNLNVSDKPIQSMDLHTLSDAELMALADRASDNEPMLPPTDED